MTEGLPWVETPPDGKKYEIIDIYQIGRAARLVPVHAENGAAVKRWTVNSRIDLNSFRWIYYD